MGERTNYTLNFFDTIYLKINKSKEKSIFNGKVKALKIPDPLKTEIIEDKEIIELTELNLIDSYGFCYSFDSISQKASKTLSYWLNSF